MRKPKKCPRCGSERIVEIIYGLPTSEAGEAAGRGELIIGGCMTGPGAPRWGCGACHWEPPYEDVLIGLED